MNVLLLWLVNSLALVFGAYVLPSVAVQSFPVALFAALVLGIVNVLLKPILLFFTLPLNILTLGLFTFVINALLILLTDKLVDGFSVGGFWTALLLALILALINGAFMDVGVTRTRHHSSINF